MLDVFKLVKTRCWRLQLEKKMILAKKCQHLDFICMSFPSFQNSNHEFTASQPTPPQHTPPRNKGLMRPYQRKPIVNKPLIRTCFWGRTLGGGMGWPAIMRGTRRQFFFTPTLIILSGFRAFRPRRGSICFKHSRKPICETSVVEWPNNVGVFTLKIKTLWSIILHVKEKEGPNLIQGTNLRRNLPSSRMKIHAWRKHLLQPGFCSWFCTSFQ